MCAIFTGPYPQGFAVFKEAWMQKGFRVDEVIGVYRLSRVFRFFSGIGLRA